MKYTLWEKFLYRTFGLVPKCYGPEFRKTQLDAAKRKYKLLSHHINVTTQLKK